MKHMTIDYRTPGSDGIGHGCAGRASLIVFLVSAMLAAPFVAIPSLYRRQGNLGWYLLMGYAASTLLSFFGAVAGCISIVSDRTSGKAWLGLLLNLLLFSALIGIAIMFLRSPAFAPGG